MKIAKLGKYPKRDLSGKQINDWKILKFVGRSARNSALYKVQCKCGKQEILSGADIENGKSKRCRSCGTMERYKLSPNRLVGPNGVQWKGSRDIPRAQYTKFAYGAKIRGLEFAVTIDDLQEIWDLQKGKCTYTGRQLIFNNKSFRVKKLKGEVFNFASLDRIDSTKGYVLGNIQWVLQAVNLAKQSYFHEQFLELIKDIYEHLNLSQLLTSK